MKKPESVLKKEATQKKLADAAAAAAAAAEEKAAADLKKFAASAEKYEKVNGAVATSSIVLKWLSWTSLSTSSR